MDDRKLLELAANAAGISGDFDGGHQAYGGLGFEGIATGGRFLWNPLLSDAAAFRLMVKLELNVFSVNGTAYAVAPEYLGGNEQQVPHGEDAGAATRLAIVMCAAAVTV